MMRKYRIDKETGKATFAIVQAEDEIAALGHGHRRGWAGARSMTSTSGPGISLMGEFTGLGYYAEIPAVIFDIQRVGPSTGLPTRTAQGDILSTALLSHGDTRHPMLLPSSVAECYEMAIAAFDLAERLQTPMFVMSDLDLGMNIWMSDPFPYPGRSDRSRQGARRSRRSRGLANGAATRTWMATPFHGGRCQARTCRPISRAVRVTTRKASTASAATTTSTTWIGWGASSTPRGTLVPPPERRCRATGAQVGLIAYGTTPLGDRRKPRSAPRRSGAGNVVSASEGISLHRPPG